ncbi:arsenate reductase family protein [Eubacteriales bacterium KG127]
METTVLCYSRCTTCKKALKWMDDRGYDYDVRPIVDDNPTVEELKKWHEASGLPLKRFFNTSGMAYREMQLKDKLPNMTAKEQYELLATDGMLVKRPLLVRESDEKLQVFPGFRENPWLEILEK